MAQKRRVIALAQIKSTTSESARRYAKALFDLAQEKGVLADIHREFAAFAKTVSGNKDLTRLISSPTFSRADKAEALGKLAESGSLPALLKNFLGVMASNGRAIDIPSTQTAFDTLYAKQRGVQRAIARTAKQMDETQKTRIQNILAKAVGGEVELTTEVDPDLIGGIQLRIGSKLIDASLKAKLDRMNTAMKGA